MNGNLAKLCPIDVPVRSALLCERNGTLVEFVRPAGKNDICKQIRTMDHYERVNELMPLPLRKRLQMIGVACENVDQRESRVHVAIFQEAVEASLCQIQAGISTSRSSCHKKLPRNI